MDTLISVPNDRLLELVPKGTSFFEAFRVADDILRQAVQGISDIITTPGMINRDFSDIRSIMLGMGYAMMGTASAKGDGASITAAREAISCPLMEEGGVRGARGVLINITGSSRLSLHDVNEACSLIRSATANEDVQINFGVVLNETMDDEVKITVIATGFQRDNLPQIGKYAETREAMRVVVNYQPEPEPKPEPEPVVQEPMFAEPVAATAAAAPEPQREPEPEPVLANDLDMPAFLRRERRYYQ